MKMFFILLFLIPVALFSQDNLKESGVDSSVIIYEEDGLMIPEVVVPDDLNFWHYRLGGKNLNGFTVFNDDYTILIWNHQDSVDVQFELYQKKEVEEGEEWYAPDYIKIPFFIVAGIVVGISL